VAGEIAQLNCLTVNDDNDNNPDGHCVCSSFPFFSFSWLCLSDLILKVEKREKRPS
jgi:hypothetical protein